MTFVCSLDGLEPVPCTSPQTYRNLTFESHTFSVQATNEYLLVEESPVEYAWTIALPEGAIEPNTEITAWPEDGTTSQTAIFRFSSTSRTPPSCASSTAGPGPACTSPKTYTGLANTGVNPPHVFQVFAVSPLGIEDTEPATHEWAVDVAPETTFDSTPPTLTTETIANFTFASNDGDATFECALDSVALSSCSNPESFEGLLPGPHFVWAAAKDAAGNVDPTPIRYDWTIGARPNAAITRKPPEATHETTATFEFTSDIPGNQGITFQCAFDEMIEEEIWAPCTSPKTYTNLIFGEHEFAVRAVDAAGNFSEFPAEYGWDIGGNAPPVLITSEPWLNDESRDAIFEFTANGSNLTFQCALDSGEFSPCVSPKRYNGLPLGPHTFEVQVLVNPDLVIEEPPITTYEWNVIQATVPDTTISFGPPRLPQFVGTAEGGSLDADVGFFFSSDDPLATFECALDGELFSSCESPAQYNATIGEHLFRVRAVDLALPPNKDATPATWEFTVVEAPETTIDSGPEAEFINGKVTFTFSSSLLNSTFQCALDMGAFTACSNTPKTYTGLPDGEHTFEVRAVSQHGIVDTTPELWEFTVENQLPDTTIVSGPGTGPNRLTTSFGGTFRFDSNDPTVAEYECSLDGDLFEGCMPVVFPVQQPDSHILEEPVGPGDAPPARPRARQRGPVRPDARRLGVDGRPGARHDDHAGAAGRDHEHEREHRVQQHDRRLLRVLARQRGLLGVHLAGPVQRPGRRLAHVLRPRDRHERLRRPDAGERELDHRASGGDDPAGDDDPVRPGTGPGSSTASTVATFRFEASELGATFMCSLDGATPSFCMPPKSYSDLALGSHTLRDLRDRQCGERRDGAGGCYTWTVIDGATTPPDTYITNAPPATTTTDTATFEFGSTQEGSTFECSIDLHAFEECTSPKTYTQIPPGEHIFYVRATNAQGAMDSSPALREWTSEDVTPPSTELLPRRPIRAARTSASSSPASTTRWSSRARSHRWPSSAGSTTRAGRTASPRRTTRA